MKRINELRITCEKPGLLAFLFFTAILITGCNRTEPLPGPFEPIDNPTTVDGFGNIGCGYDVFDNFADEYKVREHILDFNKLNTDGLVEMKDIETSTFIRTSGNDILTYASSLAVSVGLEGQYMFFSGSVTSNFSKERYSYDSYSFATYHILTNKYQLRLPTDWSADDLKPYLTSQAKTKLNDPTVLPSYIFDTYGTHCLTGIVVGARADYSVSGRTRDIKEGVSVGVYAEASFSKGYGSGSLNTSVITQQEFEKFSSYMEQRLTVYGGDSEQGNNIITKNDYDSWINSIPNKLVFCNYAQNGLIPIWEFCDNEARKSQLIAAYATWAEDREITVYSAPRVCILDLLVLEGLNVPNPYLHNNRNYYRINFDLNKSVGGSYLWLYYLPGMENDKTFTPVAEIGTVDTSDGESEADLGQGFTRINVDLNKGAGGDLIYLAFRRRTSNTDKLVTGLRVGNTNGYVYSLGTSDNNTWNGVIQHSSSNLQDLNEGSGGGTIWLFYTNQFVEESSLP